MITYANVDQQDVSVSSIPKPTSFGVSVVIPVTERTDDLAQLYTEHAAILDQLNYSYEFIFVFDGKFEELVKPLEILIDSNAPIKMITFNRSFGESTALMIAFEQAQGQLILTLPAYKQTIPEGIANVLDALKEGYDLVVTRRWPRKDSLINRIQTKGFHFITSCLTGVKFQDSSCGMRGLTRSVIKELQLYGDLHRFIPFLAYQKGFRIIEIDIPQDKADSNTRVYGLGVYLRRLLDILTLVFIFKFMKKPLRFFGLIGAGLFSLGFIINVNLAVERLLGWTTLSDRPILTLGVLLMVLGVQTGSIGLLGEMIVFTHARKLKEYTISKFLN